MVFEYNKTRVYDSIIISSVVTVHETDLRRAKYGGESHNFPEIIYVKDGFTDLCIDGKVIALKKGELIIIAPNAFHGNHDPEPCYGTATHSIISFESNAPLLKELYNRRITLDDSRTEQYLEIIDEGIKIFENVKKNGNVGGMKPKNNISPYELEKLKKHLELFLIELYHTDVKLNVDKQICKAWASFNDYLNSNLCDKITVEDMSKNLNMSPSALRKMSHECCGCGPLQYYIELKINEAKRLIRMGNMNLTEISEHLGFETIHYFSRQFKKYVGKSPREYLNAATLNSPEKNLPAE